MNRQIRILFVEDSQNDLESMLEELRNGNYEPVYEAVDTPDALIAALDSQHWDLIVLDYSMQNVKGVDVLNLIQERELNLPCIFVSDVKGEDIAVEAMKAGAADYIMKYNLKKMVPSVELALQKAGEQVRKKSESVELKKKILEHKQTEKALRKNEKRLRGILTSLHETSIAVYGREGNIISLWGSPALDKRYGLCAADVVGKKLVDLLPPDQAEKRLAEHKEVFDTGENKLVEYLITMPRGDFWHEASLCPLKDTRSNITAIVGFIRDISERKQMEEVIMQSEKLKAMSVMSAGITHEFNNILTIIKGFTLLLKEKYSDHKEVSDKIAVILKSTNDGIAIVGRMQEFTRSEVNRNKFGLVDIEKVLEQVIEFSMPRWKTISEANGITYYIDRKGVKKVPKVLGNSTELREVMLNIIFNSLDAMPEGGRLSLRTGKKGDKVILSISDTGEGMPEDVRKNIFDPFFTTKLPKGTGLGMSVSYSIIRRHGGTIEVESETGKGTTITIRLPVSKDQSRHDRRSVQKLKPGIANRRILIVDDEQAVCEFLMEFLSLEGHTVKSVCSGGEAIKLLKSEIFDLVLCDLVMPGISGRDVIAALNTLEKRPKVGLITGWSEKIKPLHKKGLKVDFIARKPFDLPELSNKIHIVFSAD